MVVVNHLVVRSDRQRLKLLRLLSLRLLVVMMLLWRGH